MHISYTTRASIVSYHEPRDIMELNEGVTEMQEARWAVGGESCVD